MTHRQQPSLARYLATLRDYPFKLRPRHLETFDSFETRLRERNFEDETAKNSILREARTAVPDIKPGPLWEAIVTTRAGLRPNHFAETALPELCHRDGSSCTGCTVGTGDQWMCRMCSYGEPIRVRAHLQQVICIRHRIWVGSGTAPEAQFHVDDAYIRAEKQYQKLRRRGRAHAATLWELLHIIDPSLTDEAEHHLMPHRPFPKAMLLWSILASTTFQRSFFDPANTFAEAYETLRHGLEPLLDEDTGLLNRVWHYLRPTALTVREWVKAGGGFTPHWEHDFPIESAITDSWSSVVRPLEPFSRYLALSGVKAIGPDNWREVLTHRSAGHGVTYLANRHNRSLPGICVNGHRVGVHTVVKVGGRTNYRCIYCEGGKAVPGETDITATHPLRASYFDAHANKPARATDYISSSNRKAHWRCPLGHNYTRSIAGQCRAAEPCLICDNLTLDPDVNSVAVAAPHLVPEWHPTLNRRSPWEVRINNDSAWFLCLKGHEPYSASIYARAKGTGCRRCAFDNQHLVRGARIAEARPELDAEWDPKLNDGLPFSELRGSTTVLRNWRCKNGHVTQKTTAKRLVAGCGVCTGHRKNRDSNSASKYPLITSEWDTELNGMPASEAPTTRKRYYWRCKAAGHVCKTELHNRRQTRGCTKCPPHDRIACGLEKGTY